MKKAPKVEVVVETKKDKLVALLKIRAPKLFDREPSSFARDAVEKLADDILCL